MNADPHAVLRDVFGYRDFRGPQQAIIGALIAGEDALVLMPTGGGKSLCYQVPALLREGTGVVVSPLIALMQDQVGALHQLGVRAAFLNSTLAPEQARTIEAALLGGTLDLLYVAPERLLQERTLDLLARARIALFAIDEAHCVAQWGHDFRADYLKLEVLHQRFPRVPRIALTATADSRTREEIVTRLALADARQFIVGFDRPNIQYRIREKQQPRQQLLRFLREEQRGHAGIVYCLSRQKTEDTAAWLVAEGFDALPYHAGLPASLRAHHQSRFLREDGVIIVATIAFGMGIDKPDVRFVAHLDLPKSIEAYYQETGRAGRDGESATALLLYGLEDVVKLRQMMASSNGDETFKRHEQQRLNAMLGLCEVASCRRQVLLRYFGDTLDAPCGNCDNCLEAPEPWEATEAVRMALSCVYRTGQRFGVNHLVEVLRGGSGERLLALGHQRLSTWGIGTALSSGQWRAVFRQLVARGFLDVDPGGHGGLRLTALCPPVLRGEESVWLRRDVMRVKAAPVRAARAMRATDAAEPAESADPALWERLRACRKRLAEEHDVPPYVIFHDTTLRAMLAQRPRSPEELRRISGVGERKLARYGEAFLAVLRED
jgi:ATP-dependent DNA helicase RecQ